MLLLWRIFAFVKTDRDVVNSHSFLTEQFNHLHPCTIFRLCIFIFHLYCLKLLEEYDNMDMTKSDQIKAGLQKSFRSGKSAKASTVCYGYRATAEGDLIVYPAEATYVFHIFERFAAGDSLGRFLPRWLGWMCHLPQAKRFGAKKRFQRSSITRNILVTLFWEKLSS